jgi:hypothetical protein
MFRMLGTGTINRQEKILIHEVGRYGTTGCPLPLLHT